MRIGVDATCWANGRGYGRYTRELVSAMAVSSPDDRFVCFLDGRALERFDLREPNVQTVVVPQAESPTEAAAANGNRAPMDIWRFTRAVAREPLDVFLSPTVYTYFPLPPRLPAVVVVHDTIAERFPRLTLPSWRSRLFWWAKVTLALYQARVVLTVSDFAARDLERVLRVPSSRIRVTGEAPAAAFRPSQPQEIRAMAGRIGLPPDARWFVYVGGFNPHKHVDVIVRAHARVAAQTRQAPPYLLLVGTTTGDVFLGDQQRVREEVRGAGTDRLVRWTGFLSDQDLSHLHSGAVALLLPSACEGFGLPAVEAAACGAAVIATTESPLPSLLAGGGVFVPPGDEEALAGAMRALLDDEAGRRRMGEAARARASVLDWSRSAAVALSALREVAA